MVSPYSLSRPGGVQGQVLALARALRRLDVDCRVLAPCDGAPPAPGVISVGASVLWENNGSQAPIATSKAVARRTIDALALFEPDLVHLHEPMVPGPTLTILLGYHGPMVSTHHIAGYVGREWAMPAVRANLERVDVRVAVSPSAQATAAESLGGSYEVLWNGVETERYEAIAPTPSTRPAVLFCNRHEPRKGLDVLLDAWSELARDAVLWVIGTGPQTEALRARDVANVEWLGVVSDAERDARLKGATLFCAPAIGGESFGIVLLEAMAAGVAVVASDIDGYRNVARDGVDARLVAPGDPIALRHALCDLLDDERLREKLIAGATERAEDLSMHRLAQRYLDIYSGVLARR